jgi:hypothetical protein
MDTKKIYEAMKSLTGWHQHYDTDIVVSAENLESTTGEFYQEVHSALDLANVKSAISERENINEYLARKEKQAVVQVVNDVLQHQALHGVNKQLLDNAILLNRYGWNGDKIVNENRFVGFQIEVATMTGLQMAINEIGLQFTGDASELEIYLFHSSQSEPIDTFTLSTGNASSWEWNETNIKLNAIERLGIAGGAFYIGYYQEDLSVQAINYSDFDWNVGECSTCGNPGLREKWNAVRKHYRVYPLYLAQGNYVKGEMFDIEDVFYTANYSWGMNFKFSVGCDLTDFFIQNKFLLKTLVQLKVAISILSDMKFSMRTNHVEESLKMLIIQDLDGDRELKEPTLPQKYRGELKRLEMNTSGINDACLGCAESKNAPKYRVL